MKRTYWTGLPQGQRYESFTGMQAAKQLGPWVEVTNSMFTQEVELSPLEQPEVMQVQAQLEAEPYAPGSQLYL